MLEAARVLLRMAEYTSGPAASPFFIAGLSATPSHVQKCGVVLQQMLQRLCPSIDALAGEDEGLRNKETNYCFRWLATTLASSANANLDGGWGMVYMCCKLIERVLQDFPAAQCRTDVVASRTVREMANDFQQVALWIGEMFSLDDENAAASLLSSNMIIEAGIVHRIRHNREFVSLLRHALRLSSSATRVSLAEEEHIASLLLECLVRTSNSRGHLAPNKFRVASMLSAEAAEPLLHSKVMEGILIDWSLPLEAQVMQLQGTFPASGLCVVFECDLKYDSFCGSEEIKGAGEQRSKRCCVDLLRSLGVVFVMSQRTIDPVLRDVLATCGCVAIERLSIRYVDAVCTLMGAPLLHSEEDLLARASSSNRSVCGYVQSLTRITGSIEDGKRQFMLLRGKPAADEGSVVTLVLHINLPCAAENFESKVRSAFGILCSLFVHGAWTVRGQGRFEAEVVKQLRGRSDVSAVRRQCLTYLSDVVELYGAQQRCSSEVMESADAMRAKVRSMQAALDVAASALQIQSVVVGGTVRKISMIEGP